MKTEVFWNIILFLWANIYWHFEDYNAFIFRVKPCKRALSSILDLCYPEYEGIRNLCNVGLSTHLHSVTLQKTRNFSNTAVKTSNETLARLCAFLLFVLKSPAADATDAPQPWRLIVQPYEEDDEDDRFFLRFHFNGAPVEWNWQGKTEVLGEKPVPVPLCPPQISHGLARDRTRASAATNLLSHGTVR